MFKLTESQVKKATEWWADRVCAPTFSGLSEAERRDPANDSYQFAEMLAGMATESVDGGQREKFIAALKEGLEAENYNSFLGLSVDYHPCQFLARAADKAGISKSNFPWKTYMHFADDGTVKAACGRGSQLETL